jgi:hypothetical protein
MNNYLEGFKKRAAVSIVIGQLALIMYQLWTLDKQKVTICTPHPQYNQIICVEQ